MKYLGVCDQVTLTLLSNAPTVQEEWCQRGTRAENREGWHVRPCYRVEGSIVHIGFSALLGFGHPVPSTHCVPFQLCIVCALLRQAHSRVWHPLCSSIRWFSHCDRIADRSTPGNSGSAVQSIMAEGCGEQLTSW